MSSAPRPAKGVSAFGPSMPLHARGAMVAQPWRGFTRGLVDAVKGRGPVVDATTANTGVAPAAWEQAARLRRRVLIALIALSTVLATTVLAYSQPTYEHPLLQWIQIGLFALLFAWVSAGCITAVMGFWVLVKGDKHALSKTTASNR
ncbi:MAG: glucans biosynthesis glucosyltransferase MdoH, partial [Massilia sp.]|nr:glucans biosynthesis glucosyltransferase MdoH [Aquabacterium sp.]